MKLLLVEDEKQLSEALTQLLIKNKYSIDAAYDGESGLDCALTGIYDIIILDIMLPKLNGLDLLKELRLNKISTPVLLLSAKGEINDKVTGLDYGADDYLAKPFSPEELLARIRALGRRKGELINDNVMEFSDIKLNILSYELECAKNNIRLGLKEFEVLRYFLDRPNIAVTKDDLITKLWGYDTDVEYNNIEVYISFLRKKLQYIGSKTTIKTLRGIGYKLQE